MLESNGWTSSSEPQQNTSAPIACSPDVASAQSLDDARPNLPHLPIVGIGASAGGLQAFEAFFSHMPSESGMAFVLVQHLDPTHESILADIIRRYTRMQVFQITDGIELAPDCIYVIPPNRDMALLNGRLHLIEPVMPRGLRLPIDFFFRSLADDLQEHAIGIVLSGAGTDGTLGLRAIKGNGGMVMVQEPASARYDGMPRSAIDTDLVDHILPPEQMPPILVQYTKAMLNGAARLPTLLKQSSDSLEKIFLLLRNQTGHDLSRYRKSMIMRRIERRMAINQITWITDYIRYLQQDPREISTLFREMFIGVTEFFRDPEAFRSLEQHVLPHLFGDRPPHEPVRVWVPGCSTGEEAYSVAMLLQEQHEARQQAPQVQLFATDIDSQAIERARNGTYPNSIVAHVSAERLGRFCWHNNESYQMNRQIRDMAVFAGHSVIKDPPFSNIDLICCRNLLIYFEPQLQEKVLTLFYRALKPTGFLFLGSAETLGSAENLFTPVDRKWQIFQRIPDGARVPPFLDFSLAAPEPASQQPEADAEVVVAEANGFTDLRDMTERLLLESYMPPCVLINEVGEILYIHGKTAKYWETPTGTPEWNMFHITREELQFPLSMLIRKVIVQRQAVVRTAVEMKADDGTQTIYITVRPVPNTRLLLIIFEDSVPTVSPSANLNLDPEQARDAHILQLEENLRAAQDYLHATNEALQVSNEELRSSNEELQSSNEELRSTNEELGTSKEELQSVNEELVTVNTELRDKIEQLTRMNNDQKNLLASMQVGTIFLDQHLHIVRFTPAATQVMHLIDADIGRPLDDLASQLIDIDLRQAAQDVLDTLQITQTEVSTHDDR